MPANDRPTYKKFAILIVDDDIQICETFKEYLEIVCNYDVDIAFNGEEALKKIISKKLSAIILDIDLPTLNGVELLKRIRAINNRVPVIIITAYPDFPGVKQAFEDSACEFLIKPVEPDRIKSILDIITSINIS